MLHCAFYCKQGDNSSVKTGMNCIYVIHVTRFPTTPLILLNENKRINNK
jgi:hypothetical protein